MDLAQDALHTPLQADEVIYGSMDGSMILTETGWQEVKVGRVFSSSSRLEAGQKGDTQTRYKLSHSTYCAHLGSAQEFIPQFEASLGNYKTTPERLVFVTDGGAWIQQYLERTYPNSTQILDYFHAVEHLAEFSRIHFKTAKESTQWLANQCTCLLSEGVDWVLATLASLTKLSASF